VDSMSMCCISTSVGSLSYDNHSFLSYVHMSMPSSLSMPVTTSWLEPSSTCSISSSVGVSYVGKTSRSYDVDKGFSRNIVPSSTTSMTEPYRALVVQCFIKPPSSLFQASIGSVDIER